MMQNGSFNKKKMFVTLKVLYALQNIKKIYDHNAFWNAGAIDSTEKINFNTVLLTNDEMLHSNKNKPF